MPFFDSNTALGLQLNNAYQVGVSDVDPDAAGTVEDKFFLPWPQDPNASWIYYNCTVVTVMDSGVVVHNHLPQVNNLPASLASCLFDDPNLVNAVGGVNLRSNDAYVDIVQRMGHTRYWFNLHGQALRIGLQVPIPGIKTIGGVPAIPYDRNPQFAFNRIAPGGNYGGIILWHAAWSLWYTTALPPRSNAIPAADPAAHISEAVPVIDGIQAPYTQPDDNAVKTAPPLPTKTSGIGFGGQQGVK